MATTAANRLGTCSGAPAWASPWSCSCSPCSAGPGLLGLPRPDLPLPPCSPAPVLALGLQAMHLISLFCLPAIENSSGPTARSGSPCRCCCGCTGRLVVFAGVLNATLWERYHEAGDAPDLVGAGADLVMAAGLAMLGDLRQKAKARRDRRPPPRAGRGRRRPSPRGAR